MILLDTYRFLTSSGAGEAGDLIIEDVRIGQYLTAVRLNDGSTGVASSLEDEHPLCQKEERDYGTFTPLHIKGSSIKDLFGAEKRSKLIASLRTAALNAISSRIISSGKYNVLDDKDPIDLIDLRAKRTITIVGAFQSYIQKISSTCNDLYILELNEDALKQDQRKYFVPASEYRQVLKVSDVVIITGQTIVNNTIDGLLSAVKKESEIVVTGPSGSMLPDILFDSGVSIIGSMKITKPELVFDIVGQAGLGHHLFRYCAKKICILNEKRS